MESVCVTSTDVLQRDTQMRCQKVIAQGLQHLHIDLNVWQETKKMQVL